jgi:hypothetical protein
MFISDRADVGERKMTRGRKGIMKKEPILQKDVNNP